MLVNITYRENEIWLNISNNNRYKNRVCVGSIEGRVTSQTDFETAETSERKFTLNIITDYYVGEAVLLDIIL